MEVNRIVKMNKYIRPRTTSLRVVGVLMLTALVVSVVSVCIVAMHQKSQGNNIEAFSPGKEDALDSSEVIDFYFGALPKMDEARLTEPDRKEARYLRYNCGDVSIKKLPRVPHWMISIAILNPNKSETSLSIAKLAERNYLLRNNVTKIRRVLSICGGAMISSRWGLTALHCVNDNRYLKVVIRGRPDWEVVRGITDSFAEIKELFLHPAYDSAMKKNDIALLKLSVPLLRYHENPVCLPNTNVIPMEGRTWYYGGWGVISKAQENENIRASNSRFLGFKVELEDPTSCQRRYKRLKYDVNYNICDKIKSTRLVGNDSQGIPLDTPCEGFSGAPLFCLEHHRWVVYGIVNWGDESCDLSLGRGYALLSTQIDWICCETQLDIPNCADIECDRRLP